MMLKTYMTVKRDGFILATPACKSNAKDACEKAELALKPIDVGTSVFTHH